MSARQKIGFTLIELCLVSLIASVIGLAVYLTFSNGMKIWSRANQEAAEEDVNVFFDRFALDIRNCLKFSGLEFSGSQDRLEFASRVVNPYLKNKTMDSAASLDHAPGDSFIIGRVAYSYEPRNKTLLREEKDLSRIFEDKPGNVKEILKDADSLKFEYYLYDKEKKEYVWLQEPPPEGVPLAVRIEFALNAKSSSGRFVRTVSIPIGG